MNGKYQSLPALPMSNNCMNLALLKQLCSIFYDGKHCANNKSSFENSFLK